MSFVELSEWSSINDNDGALYQGLGTDQLVVGCVVDDVQDTGLTCGTFRGPGKVSSLETESTELAVSTTSADKMNAGASQLEYRKGHI